MAIALIAQPFIIKRKDYAFKGILLTVVMALLAIFSFQGVDLGNINETTTGLFGYVGSAILLVLFIVFIVENVMSAKKNAAENTDEKPEANKKSITINLAKLIGGAAGIAVGAILLKDNAAELALMAGIPQAAST